MGDATQAATGMDIADEVIKVGETVASLFIPGSGVFITGIELLYKEIKVLYDRAAAHHGAAIPPLADILKKIDDNQAEIDAGKI